MHLNVEETSINIMQANLIILRYHGLWPNYLNGERDKWYRVKVVFLLFSITFLWFGTALHMINIIVGT